MNILRILYLMKDGEFKEILEEEQSFKKQQRKYNYIFNIIKSKKPILKAHIIYTKYTTFFGFGFIEFNISFRHKKMDYDICLNICFNSDTLDLLKFYDDMFMYVVDNCDYTYDDGFNEVESMFKNRHKEIPEEVEIFL